MVKKNGGCWVAWIGALGLVAVSCVVPATARAQDSDPAAIRVADQVMAALGGQAKWDALRGLPRVLRKRRELQRRRRVPVGELRAAMARDWLLPYRRGRRPAQAFESGAALVPGQAPRWRRRLRK